jgi:hypothetical protein
MKKLIYLFLFAFIASATFVSCDDDEDKIESPFKTVILGAQSNTVIDGFYSINEEKTYTMDEAFANQATIDLLCFYEEGRNDISLSSPGANITDIFTGDNNPENWTVTDTTYFYQLDSTFTSIQFAALSEDDAIIETLFNAEEGKRKAKLLQVDDSYAFQTEDNYYGILRVISVTQGETGSVEFEYIIKK